MQRIFPRLLPVVLLFGIAVLAHLPIIANPGFFNHDELQRMDLVESDGFATYARLYGAISAGPNFGYPVRPVGFVQQGASGLVMRDFPFLAHLFDVLQHATIVLLLWFVLRRAGVAPSRAAIAAAVFALSPLATLSTAWVGASFDRWYVGFALLASLGLLRAAQHRLDGAAIAFLMLGSAGAILSKESALMLPAALALVLLALRQSGTPVRWRAAFAAIVLCGVPILAYLAIRSPALLVSLQGGGGHDPYALSPARIPYGALTYFAQPFLPGAVELNSAFLLPRWAWALALLLHGLALGLLGWRHGIRWVGLYLAGYFVFLLPVLPVSLIGAHYLYGSGIAFAIMLASLIPTAPITSYTRVAAVPVAVVAVLLLARSQEIQFDLYRQGVCGARLAASLDARLPADLATGASRVRIVPAPDALGHVAHKTLFGRPAYQRNGEATVVVGRTDSPDPHEATVTMTTGCLLERT